MNVSIMGKRWDLQFCMVAPDSAGDCDAPHVPSKQIRIDQRLSGERQLEVILHEIRHAADWGQSEEFVDREAKDVARILWRLGYRKEA